LFAGYVSLISGIPVWRVLRSDWRADWVCFKDSFATDSFREYSVVLSCDNKRSMLDFISSRDWMVSRITSSNVVNFSIVA
jgi:hypothetical protein